MTTSPGPSTRTVLFDPRNVWRTGLVVLGLVVLALAGWFTVSLGGAVLYSIAMAWFAAVAMEPAVRRLARHMPRGAASGVVMASIALFLVVFFSLFGSLLLQQIATLVQLLPTLIQDAVDTVNRRFGTSYEIADILASINLTPAQAATYASEVLGGVLGLLGSVVGALLGAFTFVLLTFYFSADNPRLRLWIASFLPARAQALFVTAWDLVTLKTGGYVAARLLLAAINGGTTAVVLLLIGMPSWLALGIWTGLVAQFVPTIGTYVAILLPVLVGLLSDRPWTGLVALGWALLYQQVENLTIEPRISSRAVNIHPAVAFCSVLLGTALFGVGGALLSIPVAAAVLALVDVTVRRHELLPELATERDALPRKGNGEVQPVEAAADEAD